MSLAMAMSRVRVRIRSWKDVVLIVVAAVLIYVIESFCESKFGWDEKKSKLIAGIVVFVFAIIWLFATSN